MRDSESRFAGYRLIDVISTDAVSKVYRAVRSDAAEDVTPVALRVTAPQALDGAGQVAAFIRQARAAAGLHHPAIARTLDIGQVDDRAYVATALEAGATSLGDLVADRGPLPPAVAIGLLRDVAEALDDAHRAHVVHGAIGPLTIWVAPSGGGYRALLTGFGLEALLRGQPRAELDRAAGVDLLYVAPEQLRGRQIDSRADQYSLACALYHCVAGQPPFARESAASLFGAHLFAQPSWERAALAEDAHLRRALARGMAKEPLDRYPSCWHLIQDADRAGSETAAPPVTSGMPVGPAEIGTASVADRSGRHDSDAELAHVLRSSHRPERHAGAASPHRAAGRDRRRWLPWSVVAALVGVIAAVLVAVLLRNDDALETAAAREVQQPSPQPAPPVDVAAQEPSPQPATRIAWQRQVGQEAVGHLTAVGDAVVAASDNGMVALEVRQGTPRWQGDVDVGILTDMVATEELVVYRGATLRALSMRDGGPRWENKTSLAPTGSLAATSDIVYGMGPGRIVPELMAIDPETGKELWHFHGEEVTVDQRAAVAPTDDMVAILQNGSLFGLDPRGELAPSGADRIEVDEETWRADIDNPWVRSLVFPEGGAVIYGTQKGRVCARDPADGDEAWCTYIEALRDAEPRLLVEGDTVVVITPRVVVALDQADGARRWTFEAPQALTSVADVTASDVVAIERKGRALALALDSGEQRWRSEPLGDVTALAAVEGAVYAGTEDGAVLAVQHTANAS